MDDEVSARIKIKSNIILKSKYIEYGQEYLPLELLPKEYWDVRLNNYRSSAQKEQFYKYPFYAKRIVDEEEPLAEY